MSAAPLKVSLGDQVTVKPDQPGRFARYANKTATVIEVSPGGWVLGLRFGDNVVDWLGAERLMVAR